MTREDEPSQEMMNRLEALEREVANLQDEVATATDRTIPLLTATVRAMTGVNIDTIEELPDAGSQFRGEIEQLSTTVDELDQRVTALGDIETEKSTKEQKYAAVLSFAQNKSRTDQSKVAVTAPEIKGCVGVSRRYAYDLIEGMANDVDCVRLREATQVKTATGVKRKQKAVLVDCDAIHRTDSGVNSFTTGGDETEIQ